MSPKDKNDFIEMQFQLQDRHYKKYYPEADFLIIQYAKNDVGRLYTEEWDKEIRIIDIIIQETYQNKGIGSVVLQSIIDRAEGIDKIVSIHVDKQSQAVRFYKRLGFLIDGGTEIYHLMKRNVRLSSEKPSRETQLQKI